MVSYGYFPRSDISGLHERLHDAWVITMCGFLAGSGGIRVSVAVAAVQK